MLACADTQGEAKNIYELLKKTCFLPGAGNPLQVWVWLQSRAMPEPLLVCPHCSLPWEGVPSVSPSCLGQLILQWGLEVGNEISALISHTHMGNGEQFFPCALLASNHTQHTLVSSLLLLPCLTSKLCLHSLHDFPYSSS